MNPLDLLLSVARCPNVELCLGQEGLLHPCSRIVGAQLGLPNPEHVVPEPWSGHLADAPVLFLSSNPSITGVELAPTRSWKDEEIIDFYDNRFGGGKREWIKDGVHNLQPDGTYRKHAVRFWAAVRGRAAELLDRPADQVRPGMDYALTEIVHCNSPQEAGVADALDECVRRYFERVLAAAGAKVVVCLGKFCDEVVRTRLELGPGNLHGPVLHSGRTGYFAFLPHPNAYKPKTFAKCLTTEELERLRDFVTSG